MPVHFDSPELLSTPIVAIADQAMAISLWVKLDSIAANLTIFQQALVCKLEFKASVKRFYWTRYNRWGTGVVAFSSANIAAGQWYHLICGYDTANVWMRTDYAALSTTAMDPTDAKAASAVLVFGGFGANFAGDVAHMSYFYPAALTDEQCARLYNGGLPAYRAPEMVDQPMIGNWTFDDLHTSGANKRCIDNSGNDNHFTAAIASAPSEGVAIPAMRLGVPPLYITPSTSSAPAYRTRAINGGPIRPARDLAEAIQ